MSGSIARKGWVLLLAAATGAPVLLNVVASACAPPGKPAGPAPEKPPATLEPVSAFGHWRGYLEAAGEVAGSDEIDLVLTSDVPDKLGGSVRLGTRDASLPHDPMQDAGHHGRRFSSVALAEGKTLAISEGRSEGARVRFQAEDRGWQEWCAALVPGETGPGVDDFGCPRFGSYGGPDGCKVRLEPRPDRRWEPDAGLGAKPSSARDPDAGRSEPPSRPIDCGLLERCHEQQRRCECTGRSCVGRPTLRLRFDIRVEGASADGSLEIEGVIRRVRLEKVR